MGRDSWQFAAGDGGKTRRELKILRTDLAQGKRDIIAEIAKAKVHFGLPDDAPIHAVYEAGRDGFWFARWLGSIGVQCMVIDPLIRSYYDSLISALTIWSNSPGCDV